MSKKVAVIMGSDSDFPTVSAAVKKLKSFGVPVEVHVMSAHRTPHDAAEFSEHAKENGFGVIIAAAGKAAHLAGVLAAHTTLPVIGIPIKSSTLDGLDALLATVQMPSGIPVATVAIFFFGTAYHQNFFCAQFHGFACLRRCADSCVYNNGKVYFVYNHFDKFP